MAEAEKQPEALGVSAAPPPAQEPAADQPEAAAPGADSKSDLELHKDAPPAPEAKVQPERESTFQDYARIFSYATKWDIIVMVAGVIGSVGAGATFPAITVVFGKLIGNFAGYFMPVPTLSRDEFLDTINRLCLIYTIIFIGRFALNYVTKFAFRIIGVRMSAAIRLHYLKSLFAQSIHVLDSMPSGAAAGTITNTANTLQLGISEKLSTMIEFLTTMLGSVVIAFVYSWELTLVSATTIVFIGLVLGSIIPLIVKGTSKVNKIEAKATAIANETFSSIRMITACGAENRIAKSYAVFVGQARVAGQALSPFYALNFALVFFSFYAMWALAFYYGSKMTNEGRISGIGDIMIVLMSVMFLVMSMERISTPILAIGKAQVAASEFFAVIDAPKPDPGSHKGSDVFANQDITFEGVDFAYPSRPHVKVLDNLNLVIPAGKLTAIVGPSGSGKSTVVGLIERWYTLHDQYVIAKTIEKDKKKKDAKKKKDGEEESESDDTSTPEEPTGPAIELKGTIRVGNRDINEVEVKWWRSQIGLVQQEPFLFNESIYTNVGYGLIGSEYENESEERKREMVREACKEAFADEFIARLPEGYDTLVGDNGTKLSGGQRQRLAIARSIIKRPKILILDEATSAIDVRGERIVQAALDKVSQGRTTITIAHRLSTIKKADKIIVLKKGVVVEEGTHESLLQNERGTYWGLVHAQQLSLGEPTDDSDDELKEEEDIGAVLSREKSAALSDVGAAEQSAKWVDVGFFKGFGRLLWEQKSRFPWYIAQILFAAGAGSATPIMAWLFAKVIEIFTIPPNQLMREASFWSLMWVVLAIGVGISYLGLGFTTTHAAHFITAEYRQQYFDAILHQKTSFFDAEDNSVGTLTARVASDPNQLQELLGINMGMVYAAIFTLTGSLILAFIYNWKLALVGTCVTVPIGLAAGYYRVKLEMEFVKMYAEVFAESSKFAAEAIGAFRTVASLTLEDVIAERYNKLLQGHVVNAYKRARWSTVLFAFSDSVSFGCQALVFWYGGHLLADHEIGIVNFFVCYFAVIQGAEGAGQGLSFGPNAAQASSAANRILSIRETQNRDQISRDESIPDVDGGIKIELQDVHFRYPTRNVSIFKGLDITIEKGQFAALVGASGCGKTSIISLLERFYDPYKGKILANGRDIAELNVYEYRRNLSLVAQEPNIFQGTIRENILLGVDEESVTEEELHRVCRDASIHDFIVSLPEGYATNVGKKGVSLSGGQKQRIAIARALIRNPRILLLDEATSSLDSESEKLVQQSFERAAAGRTMVVVAHRLATVQNADIIFVLGEGKVLEKGSHAELLKKKGLYWHMCQNQALDR